MRICEYICKSVILFADYGRNHYGRTENQSLQKKTQRKPPKLQD